MNASWVSPYSDPPEIQLPIASSSADCSCRPRSPSAVALAKLIPASCRAMTAT